LLWPSNVSNLRYCYGKRVADKSIDRPYELFHI
jgi:hypothetical protein